MNIQVDPTSINLASAVLNSKIRPRKVVGYGVKIFLPSPPNYVTRSPGRMLRSIRDCRDIGTSDKEELDSLAEAFAHLLSSLNHHIAIKPVTPETC